jgi:hypothetical protein
MNRRIAHLLGAAALAALTLQPVTALADPPPHAQNDKRHDDWRYDDLDDQRYGERRYDDRYDDDRYRPWHHPVVPRLPSRARVVHYRGDRYYYGGGQWYRPYRSGYRIVAPPVGLFLSFRPEYQHIVRFGGVPHYRAGPVYYVWHPKARGYVVTDRPVRRW